MRGYVPLPSYQVPRNAMLDFSPLNQGIDAISERRQNDQLTAERKEERQYQRGRNAMADQRYADERAYSRGRDQLQDARYADETSYTRGRQGAQDQRAATEFSNKQTDRKTDRFREQVKILSGFTRDHILTEQDPTVRAQKWQRLLESHPDLKDAPDAYRDPNTGPELFLSTSQGLNPPPRLADNLTPGEKRVDQTFAKSYEDFVLSGGSADFDKNLTQLRGVQAEMTKPGGDNLTGPVLGRVPDALTAFTHPSAVDARQRVEEVVQRNLRIVLGAQFTQKEGENLIARAYNPALDEATNAKRLNRLISSMEKMKEAKLKAMDYFEEHGTMKGFKGATQFSVNDILSEIEAPDQPQAAGGGFKYIGTAD